MLKLLSDFHSGTTPHTSPLRAWYGVSFPRYTMKKWTWYIESALYPETMPTRHWVLCMIIRNFWNLSCFMILVHVKCQLPFIALHLFMKCQKEGINRDLKELMKYPLTSVPHSVGTADGLLAKTDKSKGIQRLIQDQEDPPLPNPDETLVIQDGNAVFHYMKDIPSNFNKICAKVFDVMPHAGDVVFSTYSYNPYSIKSMERLWRGCGERLIIKEDNTKGPMDWKAFLNNDTNKQQFITLLTRLWSQDSYAPKLWGRKVVIINDGSANLLTSNDCVKTVHTDTNELKSTQEETDSRIFYCEYRRSEKYRHLRVKSPDTDVFFILLHYALKLENITILFDTGTGNKKRLINVIEMAQEYGQEYCPALLGMYAFSGCDSTSAFKGKEKIQPLKKLSQMPKFVPVFVALGESWDISLQLFNQLERFTCAMYGRP